jgi:two-component system, OmpR family, phosphate regulon response regulator OmpR
MEHDTPARVLVVDDEPQIVDIVVRYLQDDGFLVTTATEGTEGVKIALEQRPDLIVLDLNLPGLHGSEVLRRVRAVYDVPIIMLTSRVDEVDRVVGLEIGADDYIGKPFSPRELVARARTVLRRMRGATSQGRGAAERATLRIGAIEIDPGAHEVRLNGTLVALTPMEFRLLDALATNAGLALTRTQLLDQVASDGEIFDRTLDRHIANLRRKIEDDPTHPRRIITVLGVGYKMPFL